MNEVLDTLQPQEVFAQFKKILSVPRPSKKEAKISQYLYEWGVSRGLDTTADLVGNIIIRKKATPDMADRKMVCLQAHMDMVCEKNSDKVFDFEKDAIEARVEDGWLKANGTTLGADDGIGIATALAILDSKTISHPDLECLFTIDEETGLTGATALADDALQSEILINLDSEDEGEMFIGCAGGVDTLGYMPIHREKACEKGVPYAITIKGLKGGHSGDDINKGLGCANKLLNRVLWQINNQCKMRLCDFNGGNLRNAIAREATAQILINPSFEDELLQIVDQFTKDIKYELRTTEPTLEVIINKIDRPQYMIAKEDVNLLLDLLYAIPHGVLAMSREIPGFVETSTNLASVKVVEDEVHIVTSQRSSVESALDAAKTRVEACMCLVGCRVEHTDGYPGWAPNTDSEILAVVVASYERLFGKKPIVRAIHAGLECGLIGKKYPKMDMISYGPTLRGVHSPDERMDLKTMQMFWDHTLDILKNIPKK
jgi:dipeptidase D